MPESTSKFDDVTRLQAVQARVRALVKNTPWFREAMQAAFNDFLVLCARRLREQRALSRRQLRLVRALSESGWVVQAEARSSYPCLIVKWDGLCSASLAEQVAGCLLASNIPAELEHAAPAAALKALERQASPLSPHVKHARVGQSNAGEAQEAEKEVRFQWTVALQRPADWLEPPDPRSVDVADLQRFSERDYRTIALYRLGGLADLDAAQFLIREPVATGREWRDWMAASAWYGRFPSDNGSGGSLSAAEMPADIAEQMCGAVEAWVAATCPSSTPVGHPTSSDTADVYLVASAFPLNMAARLRMAARPKRKTKRVATRRGPYGEQLYSLKDAMRWWPRDFKDWVYPPAGSRNDEK